MRVEQGILVSSILKRNSDFEAGYFQDPDVEALMQRVEVCQ